MDLKVAIVGSRSLTADIGKFVPPDTTLLISGGARGIDRCVREFAKASGIPILEYLPEYEKYKGSAPILRNIEIVNAADLLIAFWDGKSKGTKFTIDRAQKLGKKVFVITRDDLYVK